MNIIPLRYPPDRCTWPKCKSEPVEDQIPLCERHYTYIGERFLDERSVLGSAFVRSLAPSEELKRERAERDQKRAIALEDQSVVYYVRIGDHIKIGYSTNLRLRLNALRVDPDKVLATEPGGRLHEARRHAEFADERVGRREDFNPSRRLLAHIEDIKRLHGEPKVTTYPKVR